MSIDLGIVPTPTLQLAVQHWQADGAVAITASHNPAEWNALKFFEPSGMYLDAEGIKRLRAIYESGEFKRARWKGVGHIQPDTTAIDRHIERILTCVDVERIRSRKFKVVIDCVNGAACFISPRLLERLGCEVVPIFAERPEFSSATQNQLPKTWVNFAERLRKLALMLVSLTTLMLTGLQLSLTAARLWAKK